MFPNKTDKFSFISSLTDVEIENLLKKNIFQDKLFQLNTDNSFYGYIKKNESTFSLGQYPYWNSFRPIVKLTWKNTNKGTEINGYLSLDKRISISLLILPVFGIYLSILNKMIIPFIFMILLYLFLMFVLFLPIYSLSKRYTIIKLGELITKLQKNK